MICSIYAEEALTENKGNQDKEGEAAVQTTETKAEKAPDAKEVWF